jgi:hypothetical protein
LAAGRRAKRGNLSAADRCQNRRGVDLQDQIATSRYPPSADILHLAMTKMGFFNRPFITGNRGSWVTVVSTRISGGAGILHLVPSRTMIMDNVSHEPWGVTGAKCRLIQASLNGATYGGCPRSRPCVHYSLSMFRIRSDDKKGCLLRGSLPWG